MPPYAGGMDRLAHLLGADEDWRRPPPSPTQRRTDVLIAVAVYLLAALSIELMRSLNAFDGNSNPGDVVTQHLVAASMALMLVFRRSHPLTVAALGTLHLYVMGSVEPLVAGNLVMQVAYFFGVYTAVAWGRDRRALSYLLVGLAIALLLWLAWMFAVSSGLQDMYANLGVQSTEPAGVFSPPVAAVGYVTLNNLLFFGGAVLLGQVAWRGALHTQREVAYAETIRAQAARLRDQAVVAERLRIARELHDVVAHHVSVMGVQAAAARRVLTKNPDAAREALGAIEGSSRSAVGQMRELLGTLRSGELAADGADEENSSQDRAPQPDLDDLDELVLQATTPICTVTYSLVEESPGAAGGVPAALQLTAYRIVQESLANVRRHSTATRASVVIRVNDAELEVEVLDNGAPRPSTSGTGLGQQGMRERADLLGGSVEMGPRHGPGYRVRVILPLTAQGQVPVTPGAAGAVS